MRSMLRTLLVALLLVAPAAAADRPNLLLITGDDLGLQLGAYGDAAARTPHMDALAAAGMKFTRAYVTQASCSPSRASMLTGLYPHQNGQIGLSHRGYHMRAPAPASLPSLLKAAGYKTGIIGKLHVAPESAFAFDFKRTNYAAARNVDEVAKQARAFIESAGGEPFFLMANFSDPHEPFTREVNGRPAHPASAAEITPWPWLPAGNAVRKRVADFYTCIRRMDEGVGLLMDSLRERGLERETLVMLLGDNGPPFARAKGTSNEAGVRTPLLAAWPGRIAPGQSSEALVCAIDLMPTFLESAAIPAPSGLAGTSLWPLLRGERPAEWRAVLATEYTSHTRGHFFPQRSIRDARWKLTLHLLRDPALPALTSDATPIEKLFPLAAAPDNAEHVALYDLESDPHERRNLGGDPAHTAERARLLAALQRWREQTHDPLLDLAALVKLAREHLAK
jgi:N-sulfoglucosamine sulfohydrolase